jgi:hypothetical protein
MYNIYIFLVAGDPHNYQFYFNKIQVVGNLNFEEDHKKIYSGLNASHVKPSSFKNQKIKENEQQINDQRKDSRETGDTRETFENKEKSDKCSNGLSPYSLPKDMAANTSTMKINNVKRIEKIIYFLILKFFLVGGRL